MAANTYTISFLRDKNTFILTNEKGKTIKVNSKHNKYEWLKGQEKGKVVKISDSGRWTSSKDYNGLYDTMKILSKNKIITKNTTSKQSADITIQSKIKSAKLQKTDKTNEKTARLQEEIIALHEENIRLQKELAENQKETSSISEKLKSAELKNNGLINAIRDMKSQKNKAISDAEKLQNFYDNTYSKIECRDRIFREQVKKRENMSSNHILALILRLKKDASTSPEPAAKTTVTIPKHSAISRPDIQEKDYKISLSYSLDGRTGLFHAIKKGWSELEYGSFIYRDIKSPTKTYAKQLATYYLLNHRGKMDEKFKTTEGIVNVGNCTKVRVEIISIT